MVKQITIGVIIALMVALLTSLASYIRPDPFIHLLGGYTKADVEKTATPSPGLPAQPVPSLPSIGSAPAAPKQFYSEHDKNQIADALQELGTMLDAFVPRIDSGVQGIYEVNPVRLQQAIVGLNKTRAFYEHKPPPTDTELMDLASAAADRSIKSGEALRGVLKELDAALEKAAKFPVRVFDRKMQEIVQKTEGMRYTSQVVGKVDNCIYRVETAQKFGAKYPDTDLFMELVGNSCFQELAGAVNDLKQWIAQTKRRADDARNEL